MPEKYERRNDKIIDAIHEDVREIRTEQVAQGKDIAALKVKAGVWGGVSGAATATGMFLWMWIRGR